MTIRAAALLLCSLSHVALAEDRVVTLDRTCVEIDEAADRLAAPDRDYATRLFRQVLERADLLVVASGCTETYRLSHEIVDNRYVIHVQSSAGKRRMTTPALDELGAKYGRLVHSLLEAKAAAVAAAGRPAEPAAPSAPQPAPAAPTPAVATAEPADSLEPLATGDAATPAATSAATDEETPGSPEPAPHRKRMWYALIGPSFGGGAGMLGGYRRDLTNAALDVSVASRTGGDDGTSAVSLGAELLRQKWITPASQVYGGGGFSFGKEDHHAAFYPYGHYWGSGLQGELTAGLRVGKDSLQFLVQLDVTVPFYEMGNDVGDKYYAGAGVLSLGLGW